MIKVKIKMVDGTEYNISDDSDSLVEFHKQVIAPYGNNSEFIEIIPGELIYTGNIVSIKEIKQLEDKSLEVIK